MSDVQNTAGPSARASWEARIICGVIALAFAIGVIVALLVFGNGNNPLHTSAQNWAWMLLFAVLGGFGLPATADLLALLKK